MKLGWSSILFVFVLPAIVQSGQDPRALLQRSIDVVGVDRANGRVLHFHAMEGKLQNFQSDRTYEPFFSWMSSLECWFDPQKITQRGSSISVFPGIGPDTVPLITLNSVKATYLIRDTSVTQTSGQVAPDRRLNVWMVLRDWQSSNDLQLKGRELYRDYWRDVLVRRTERGEERLFLDPKTGFPIKLDLEEKHYLWGQLHVEYVFSNWETIGGSFFPLSCFRVVDGTCEVTRTVGKIELVPREKVPTMVLPGVQSPAGDETPVVFRSQRPDTVRLSDHAALLVGRAYTEGIAYVGGTVFVFEATQGEERAKHDADWIKKLFPGTHPIVVVVTDMAWPHIAGVRYWVSQGATIVSHSMSETFLRKVIDRKWTLNPDELEDKRQILQFNFIGVDSARSFAKGKVQLYAIDGIGSEGALMVYLPDEKFLWASDYIQTVSQPTAYANEIRKAVRRVGISPERVAAEHLGLTRWSVVDSLIQSSFPTVESSRY